MMSKLFVCKIWYLPQTKMRGDMGDRRGAVFFVAKLKCETKREICMMRYIPQTKMRDDTGDLRGATFSVN